MYFVPSFPKQLQVPLSVSGNCQRSPGRKRIKVDTINSSCAALSRWYLSKEPYIYEAQILSETFRFSCPSGGGVDAE
jgi:hypothetical protein